MLTIIQPIITSPQVKTVVQASPRKPPPITPTTQSKRTTNKTQINAYQRRLGDISPIREYAPMPLSQARSGRQQTSSSTASQFASSFNEFEECSKCEAAKINSLDCWMDHLGTSHPVPTSWLSDRASSLQGYERNHPYTAVVDSHKKRKAETIPRPLNSFMIFAQYIRRLVLYVFPEAPNVHISRRIGHLWRTMNGELRAEYSHEAQRLQELHGIEFPDYKYRPRKRLRPPSLVPTEQAKQEEEFYKASSPRKHQNLSGDGLTSPVMKSRSHLQRKEMASPLKTQPVYRMHFSLPNSNNTQDHVDGTRVVPAFGKRPAILSSRPVSSQPVILRKNNQKQTPLVISKEAPKYASSEATLTALVYKNAPKPEPLAVLTSNSSLFPGDHHNSPIMGNLMLYNGQSSHNGYHTPTGSSISPNSACIAGPNSDLSKGEYWHNGHELVDLLRVEKVDEPPTIKTMVRNASSGFKLDACFDECANMQAPCGNQIAFADICTADGCASLDDLNTLSLFQPGTDKADEILAKLDELESGWVFTEDENNNTIPCVLKTDE
ncbi:hypothetical protein Ciccas_002694 [Cichlidogyrus casuarinus]|uniref:Sex-determining region Y protein n=1 Tax=Cichlidogyrus casuarinus TaxID=1844966 RepID=A0ABD2QGH7_9PLAT